MKDEQLSNSIATLVHADVSDHTKEVESAGFNRLWVTTRHGRRFMLKGLKPEYCGKPEFEELLRKEFELLMRLDHPSIVRVWGMERLDGKGNCILMDYIDGEPLSKFMESRPPKADRLRIAREVAESLAYIHAVGVWHRDLKPDNIMVTHSGRHIRLIDFGLGDSDNFVSFKGSGATRTFGAPEQIRERRGDSRSDVYSFGKLMQYLQLPPKYALIRHSCLATDPARRPTMESVLKNMKRMEQWRWRVLVPASVGMAAIIIATILLSTPKQDAPPSEKTPIPETTELNQTFGKTNNAVPENVPAVPATTAPPATAPANKVTPTTPEQKQEAPTEETETDAFEKDRKACFRKILDEGTPYIEQYIEARKQGMNSEDAENIRQQAYEIVNTHWIPFITKWGYRMTGEEGEKCNTLIQEEVIGHWAKLMEDAGCLE